MLTVADTAVFMAMTAFKIIAFIFNPTNLMIFALTFEAAFLAVSAYNAKGIFDFVGRMIDNNVKAVNFMVDAASTAVSIFGYVIGALGTAADIAIKAGQTFLNALGTVAAGLVFLFK
jgi:spore maturation protein SpmB